MHTCARLDIRLPDATEIIILMEDVQRIRQKQRERPSMREGNGLRAMCNKHLVNGEISREKVVMITRSTRYLN